MLLAVALVVLRYVDDTPLSDGWKWLVRLSAPAAAILLPLGFFLSVLRPDATTANGVIHLVYVGAAVLAIGLAALGAGLLRQPGSRQ